MLVPIISARSPTSSMGDAKANTETLAWFGTAYGRRDHSIDRAEMPGFSVSHPAVLQGSPATTATTEAAPTEAIVRPIVRQRRYAQLVVLGGVLAALLALRTMPIVPPPSLGPVYDAHPINAAPHVEASASITPQRTLPPAVPLGPVSAPTAEARLAAAPAPAPIPRPDPVTVTEGRGPEVQPSPAPVVKEVNEGNEVKANLPAAQRPLAAPPSNKSVHPDLIAGQAHFTKGDLPAARRAFAKAMDTGLPEAALALGNTFDPVSLAKVGLKDKGDPAAARRWYRRAFELALSSPSRPRSTMRRQDRRGQ